MKNEEAEFLVKPTSSHCRYLDELDVHSWEAKHSKYDWLIFPQSRYSEVERLFRQFADKWYKETNHLSFMRDKAVNSNYQYILGLGSAVLPFLLRELCDKGGHWFWALRHITRENPVPSGHAGDIGKMREHWLHWGRDNGHLR